MLVIERLQVCMHGFQLSVESGKSSVPSLGVRQPPVPHQHKLLLVLHLLSLTASLANCLDSREESEHHLSVLTVLS